MNNTPQEKGSEKDGTGTGRGRWITLFIFFLCLAFNLFSPLPESFAGEGKMTDRLAWPLALDGWTWNQEDLAFDRATLFNHIDGGAEVYLAYNFQRAFVHRYVKAGQPDIVVEVYQMGSSADAFGVFSLERQDPEVGIGQGSEFGGSLLRFWKGRYFVSVLGEGEGKDLEAAVLGFGRALAASIKETGEPPKMLGYLPDLPWLSSSDKLFFVRSHILLNKYFFISHENLLKLASDVQAVFARYPQEKNKIRVLIARYPTQARAASAFASFRSAYMSDADRNNMVRMEDQTWTKSEHYREFIIVVFGTSLQFQAEGLIQSILTKIKEKTS
jgi:hypothetical protein